MTFTTNESEIDLLFSPEVELRQFSTTGINHIAEYGSILYTVFLDQSEFIYVGIGGTIEVFRNGDFFEFIRAKL